MMNNKFRVLTIVAILAAMLACNRIISKPGVQTTPTEIPVCAGEDCGSPTDDGAENLPPADNGNFADASEVQVTLGYWYIDNETGFLNVFGTVINNSDTPITGQVNLKYYDKSGKEITATVLDNTGADSVTFTAPITPGMTGFFFRPRDLNKLSNHEVGEVKAELWYAMKEKTAPAGKFSDIQTQAGDPTSYSGTVKNVGNAVCTSPSVEVAYLHDGKLIYLAETVLENDLAMDAEATFSGEFSGSDIREAYTDVEFALTCGVMSFER